MQLYAIFTVILMMSQDWLSAVMHFKCHTVINICHTYVCCALFSVTLYAQLHCFTLSVALDGTGAGRLEVVPYWLNLVRYTWSLHIFHTLLATPFT